MDNSAEGMANDVGNYEGETLEDRMLRQILEESLKQSRKEEQDRHAAAEASFREQLRAAHDQNRVDQRKREEELEAQAEAALNRQIMQAMEMSRMTEEERVKKNEQRADELLRMDQEFGSKNQGQGVGWSNSVVGSTSTSSTSSARVVDVRVPARSNTVQSPLAGHGVGAPASVPPRYEPARNATVTSTAASNVPIADRRAPTRSSTVPPAGRGTGAPVVSSTPNGVSADRQRQISTPTAAARTTATDAHRPSPSCSPSLALRNNLGADRQCPVSTPIVSPTANQPDIQSQGPTGSPSVSSTRTASGPVGQAPTRNPSVSHTRNLRETRPILTRSSQGPFAPGVIGPFFLESSSWQTRTGGQNQQPDQLGRERRSDNEESPITNRSDLSRRSTSSSTASRNGPVGPAQGERTALHQDNDSQRPSNRPPNRSPSLARNLAPPPSSQRTRSLTLPSDNRNERRVDSRTPESRAGVSGSRPPSQRSSSRSDHHPNEMALRTRTIHEGSLNSVPSRRSTVAEREVPGSGRREVSAHPSFIELGIPNLIELGIPSMSQGTTPRVTPAQTASHRSPSPQNSAQSVSTGSGNLRRSTSRAPRTQTPNESGDTPVNLDSGLETGTINRPPTVPPLTGEGPAGLIDDQIMARALSGSLAEEDLAGMTEEQLIEMAVMQSNGGSILDDFRAPPNMTAAQLDTLFESQMRQTAEESMGGNGEEDAEQDRADRLMEDIPRYHEIVGTWDEWHEKEKGIAPALRPKRLPEYGVPSGRGLTYVTSWAPEISLEQALIISNRDKDEYWNRVRRGEITDIGTEETPEARKARGIAQKKHIEAVSKIPTAKELEKRYAGGNPVSREATPSQGIAGPSAQGGEGAA